MHDDVRARRNALHEGGEDARIALNIHRRRVCVRDACDLRVHAILDGEEPAPRLAHALAAAVAAQKIERICRTDVRLVNLTRALLHLAVDVAAAEEEEGLRPLLPCQAQQMVCAEHVRLGDLDGRRLVVRRIREACSVDDEVDRPFDLPRFSKIMLHE